MIQKQPLDAWKIKTLGDHALQFSLPALMDSTIAAQIKDLNHFMVSQQLPFIKDLIPAYHTLTLIYDIEILERPLSFAQTILKEFLDAKGRGIINAFNANNSNAGEDKNIIRIPVCYDISLGIDLELLSIEKNSSPQEIIQIHTNQIYQVYCIGFLPGFAYMGKVDSSIQSPRHATPRPLVMAGSVGIAGEQTGIYPMNSPGGWKIIGRTPRPIFNKEVAPYASFKMGDQVQFYSISIEEFTKQNEYENEHT